MNTINETDKHKENQKLKWIGYGVIGVLAVILAYTNPPEEQFKRAYRREIYNQLSAYVDTNSPIVSLMMPLVDNAIYNKSRRKNYLIFSTLEVENDKTGKEQAVAYGLLGNVYFDQDTDEYVDTFKALLLR